MVDIYIKQALPNAKFIFIHRHPFRTLSSTMKAIRLSLNSKNRYVAEISRHYNKIFEKTLLLKILRLLFLPRISFGFITIVLYMARSAKYYIENIGHLSPADYIEITYENLCKRPDATIESIMNFLGVKQTSKTDLKSLMKPRKTQLDDSVVAMRHLMLRSMRDYFNRFGYKVEDMA